MLQIFPNLLIVLGTASILFSGVLVFQRYNPQRLAFASTPVENISSINTSQTPKRLIIKKLNIDLTVYPSKINNNRWEASNQGVSYLTTSTLPGELGNSIFYGHNYLSLLGNLTKAKPGQDIEIIYDDNSSKKFTIEYTQEVDPNQTEILDPSIDSRITIYTCSGLLDTKRFVVVGILQENLTYSGH